MRLCLTVTWSNPNIKTEYLHNLMEPSLRANSELIVKYNIGLKTLLQRGISEPIFHGDLVHKFKRIVGKPYNFSDQFKKITKHNKKVGYNLDIM